MELVDTHSHLYLPEFIDDIEFVLERAIDQNVKRIVLPNIDSSTIEALNGLCLKYPGVCFPAMGLHPTSVKHNFKDEMAIIEKELAKNKYIAIGETGIDLYWDKTFYAEQCQVFSRQIDMAKNMHLPIIIHCRESFNEIYAIVEKYADSNLFGIFHSFPGTVEQARKVIDMGFKIGVNGVVTFKNSQLPEVIRQIALTDIMLETDAPFLTPVPKRGQRNESAYLVHIASKVAEIKNEQIAHVINTTSAIAEELFGFSKYIKG